MTRLRLRVCISRFSPPRTSLERPCALEDGPAGDAGSPKLLRSLQCAAPA
jgi:hypothetical protein